MTDEQGWDDEAREAWLEPWEQRRGLGRCDYTNRLILVRANLPVVSAALSREFHTPNSEADREVLDQQIVYSTNGLIVFQLQGHVWTILLPGTDNSQDFPPEWLVPFSKQPTMAGVPVVAYSIDENARTIGYAWYEGGECLEVLFAQDLPPSHEPTSEEEALEEEVEEMEEVEEVEEVTLVEPSKPSAADPPEERFSLAFSSERGTPKPAHPEEAWPFCDELFLQHDAFEPGLSASYFLGEPLPQPGLSAWVKNPGLTLELGEEVIRNVPKFVGVRYLTPC